MMKCHEVVTSLVDFIDDSLPLVRRQAVAGHLRECSACARMLNDVRCTRRMLRRLPRDHMPDPMKKTLLDRLRERRNLVRRSPSAPPLYNSPTPDQSPTDAGRSRHDAPKDSTQ